MIHVKESVRITLQCEPREIQPQMNGIHIDFVIEIPQKLYFSYVKLENVTKILPVLTFQKFKFFGPDQMFQMKYFHTQHHLVTYPLPTRILTRR